MYTAKCTGRLKSVDPILRSKARFAALDPYPSAVDDRDTGDGVDVPVIRLENIRAGCVIPREKYPLVSILTGPS